MQILNNFNKLKSCVPWNKYFLWFILQLKVLFFIFYLGFLFLFNFYKGNALKRYKMKILCFCEYLSTWLMFLWVLEYLTHYVLVSTVIEYMTYVFVSTWVPDLSFCEYLSTLHKFLWVLEYLTHYVFVITWVLFYFIWLRFTFSKRNNDSLLHSIYLVLLALVQVCIFLICL